MRIETPYSTGDPIGAGLSLDASAKQRENGRLHHRLAELTAALAKARGEAATAARQLETMLLREQLAAQR